VSSNHPGTVPLPLALHLAMHMVIGLFCLFAGGVNLSWGYVFGILMARREVVMLGWVANSAYVAAGLWQLGQSWWLGAVLLGVGVYGLAVLAFYRRRILEA
jgi:hypothetical protein